MVNKEIRAVYILMFTGPSALYYVLDDKEAFEIICAAVDRFECSRVYDFLNVAKIIVEEIV